jgi:hypothetical protein
VAEAGVGGVGGGGGGGTVGMSRSDSAVGWVLCIVFIAPLLAFLCIVMVAHTTTQHDAGAALHAGGRFGSAGASSSSTDTGSAGTGGAGAGAGDGAGDGASASASVGACVGAARAQAPAQKLDVYNDGGGVGNEGKDAGKEEEEQKEEGSKKKKKKKKKKNKLGYLDGLRGVMCVVVIIHHFCCAFFPVLVRARCVHLTSWKAGS